MQSLDGACRLLKNRVELHVATFEPNTNLLALNQTHDVAVIRCCPEATIIEIDFLRQARLQIVKLNDFAGTLSQFVISVSISKNIKIFAPAQILHDDKAQIGVLVAFDSLIQQIQGIGAIIHHVPIKRLIAGPHQFC